MKHIDYVFFDLDRTVWDFERCSLETLGELFQRYHGHIGEHIAFERFISTYRHHNTLLWRQYERSEITSAELRILRWENTFRELEVEMADWSLEMGKEYLEICPRKPYLVEGAVEILDYLQRQYEVHMITNGWTDTQQVKLEHSGLARYFGKVITSDAADAKKPDRRIFDYALSETGAKRERCIYIGDNYECDVEGGMNAGWDVIFFNPDGEENPIQAPQIQTLRELNHIL